MNGRAGEHPLRRSIKQVFIAGALVLAFLVLSGIAMFSLMFPLHGYSTVRDVHPRMTALMPSAPPSGARVRVWPDRRPLMPSPDLYMEARLTFPSSAAFNAENARLGSVVGHSVPIGTLNPNDWDTLVRHVFLGPPPSNSATVHILDTIGGAASLPDFAVVAVADPRTLSIWYITSER